MSVSYQQIIQDIEKGKFAPVYFLAGEESFFIDEIEKAILKHAFQPGEEDFNLDIAYGKDISGISEILNICQQYPVFASRRVVVVREAQHLSRKDQWEPLANYVKQPMDSTVLVILFKHKLLDKRWDVTKKIVSSSLYFESGKLKEDEVPHWIKRWIESAGFRIDQNNSMTIAENLGNDLSRIVNETEKLTLILPQGAVIDAEAIEKYIGISRDYNSFELSNAVQQHNIAKAVKIIDYFSKNPKSGPFPLIIGTLYTFFSRMWLYYQMSPDEKRNDAHLNKVLGGYYGAMNVKSAARFYSAQKSEQAIALLAEYDVRSKGVDNKNTSEYELMLELIYKLMH